LTYVSSRGRTLIDRELYLPASWCADRTRCAEAGIGQDVEFVTKPRAGRLLLGRLSPAGQGPAVEDTRPKIESLLWWVRTLKHGGLVQFVTWGPWFVLSAP
jgi:hypothetical protein